MVKLSSSKRMLRVRFPLAVSFIRLYKACSYNGNIKCFGHYYIGSNPIHVYDNYALYYFILLKKDIFYIDLLTFYKLKVM